MPLRSVEAATRDDAIAAAREQFGPSARVVGVRRVRSGGVLGFFATERYVAEVAPDLTNRPAVPAVSSPAEALSDDVPADFSSPLASAAPARARAAAPARNGAAAWAAEAVRSTDTPSSTRTSTAAPSSSSTWSAAPAARSSAPAWQSTPAAAAPAKRPAPVEDDRVSELAALLTAKQAEADTPAYARSTFPRASFPRTGPTSSFDGDVPATPFGRDADKRVIPADVLDAPSPFTAALARMVAGDRDVQQAVEEALVRPGTARPGADAEPRPSRPGRTAESSVSSPATRQEEETVGDQVIAPSSSMTQTVEVPTWAAEPDVATASVSSREEAIAEVLRSALAQGHSDEALAGILRKVLAGASPQTALTTPDADAAVTPQVVLENNVLQDLPASPAVTFAVPEVAVPEVAVPEAAVPQFVAPEVVVEPVTAEYVEDVAFEDVAVETPAIEQPTAESPAPEVVVPEVVMPEPAAAAFEVPVFEAPVHEAPIFEVPMFESRTAAPVETSGMFASAPAARPPSPAWVAAPATNMWGPPSMSATLWGEPVAPAATIPAPIWAEVASGETSAPSVEAFLFDEPVDEVAEESDAPEADAPEAVVEEEPEVVAESEVEEPIEEELAEAVAEELAPFLARTASDPAPMMSFDSTTVMPPLSLLPPLPGSRGRGRPPVPPAPSRRAVPPPAAPAAKALAATPPAPTAPAVEPAAPETDAPVVPAAEDVWAPLPAPAQPAPSRLLATVTRLPVAPLMASPEVPEFPEHLFEPAAPVTTTATATATVAVAEPVASAPGTPAAPATGEVADRLVELGVPRALLGATFADAVAEMGTYAALTRALALHLPTVPELPTGAGEVLFVVGPGIETLRAAQTLAASLRLDPDRVQWATRGDLAGLAPESSRVTTVGAAITRRQDADIAGTVTIVAVDAPMRTDAYWTAQMMAIWTPVAVWAVVEATRKPEDLEPWIDGLPQVDALIVQDTDLSADPAAVLRRVDAPVALIDGARATPHRWASLLCERLENPQT
ncbi:hypothetical protein [Blastococcus sp. CT_GayMR16]|uniref:hypothetical protein n=1 Tax=Blastococcus sp. CT_GayMR16 TaxID=2559607 RepID=UPI0010745D17|nr:hypothetical protein [Blastococcus sp. CT_GayMR16]TFV83076.1 hypothetical protein E4P38_21345 [Blastococcus sp. CT_GayMR16]